MGPHFAEERSDARTTVAFPLDDTGMCSPVLSAGRIWVSLEPWEL